MKTSLLFPAVLFSFIGRIYAQDPESQNTTPSEPPQCTKELEGDFNLPLHIGAVFIVMVVSLTGLFVPVASLKLFGQRLKKSGTGFQSLKLFGAGVILATALVHMLVPAFESLSEKCLPKVFSEDYGAWAAVFAISGIFLTHLVQIIIRHNLIKKKSFPGVHSKLSKDSESLENSERKISVFVLEFGVMLHSVIIGIILGFARNEFIPLLIALGFHQFFEGMALSTIILDTNFSTFTTLALTFVAYCLSTPVGVSLGIIAHQIIAGNYSVQAEIVTTGVLEAFGAGILLYDVLVNIIAPHFCLPSGVQVGVHRHEDGEQTVGDGLVGETDHMEAHGEEDDKEHVHAYFMNDTVVGKIAQMGALYLGAIVMSVIGKWA